jgi:hypothetical protein
MFDFLKDGKYAEKKYKSSNQIPMFSSVDIFSNKNDQMNVMGLPKNQFPKDETFTPFFSIEEDLMMEDEISNSDCVTSKSGQESVDSEFYSPGVGKLPLLKLKTCLWFTYFCSYI